VSDFGCSLEQYGPRHEMSGRASKADLRRRIAELERHEETWQEVHQQDCAANQRLAESRDEARDEAKRLRTVLLQMANAEGE